MTVLRLRLASLFPILAAVTLCAFTGCASSTVLQSNPPGARISVNGVPVGNTPYTMTDTKIIGSTTPIRLEYPGYQTIDTTISRNEELDVGALIAGVFFLIPLLWVQKYQPVHSFQMVPGGAYPRSPGCRGRPPVTRSRPLATRRRPLATRRRPTRSPRSDPGAPYAAAGIFAKTLSSSQRGNSRVSAAPPARVIAPARIASRTSRPPIQRRPSSAGSSRR